LEHIALHAHGVRCSQLIYDKFALLKSWGFEVPMYAVVNEYHEMLEQVKAFSEYRSAYGLPTDGIVVEGSNTKALRIYGWEEPIYKSYVMGFEETYGPHSIAIQCLIFPIKLANSVQRRLPVTNISRVIGLNLRIGNPVAFRIASSAIADVDEVSTGLLQKEWQGREETYQYMVRANEALKE
jgi:NAD-dependent DNA ligase